MNYFKLIGIASLLLLQNAAFAYDYSYKKDNEDQVGSFYVGAGVGYSLGDTSSLCSDHDKLSCMTWKAFAGYHPTESVAIEGGYQNLMSGRYSDGTKINTTALSLSALIFRPINNEVTGFGKIGFAAWKAHTQGHSAGADGTDLLLGVGSQMKVNENLGVRAEAEYIGGDLNSANFSAGITYSTF